MEIAVKVMLVAITICLAGGFMVITSEEDARLDLLAKIGVPLFILGVTVATLALFSLLLIGITK